MQEDLIAYILADAGVSAAVSNRVFWTQRKQGSALPAVVLTTISSRRDYAMGGPSGLVESRVQVDSYGETYAAAKSAARSVITLLSGAKVVHGSTQFDGAFVDGERDSFESDPNSFRVSVDLLIWHQPTGT